MATMTATHAFVAPFEAPPLPDWFKTGTAELVVTTEAQRPVAVALRCFPTAFEFQVWAPRLVAQHGLPASVFDLAHGLDRGRPVVTLVATPARVAALGPLAGVEDLGAWLQAHVALFAPGGFGLDAVSFEPG